MPMAVVHIVVSPVCATTSCANPSTCQPEAVVSVKLTALRPRVSRDPDSSWWIAEPSDLAVLLCDCTQRPSAETRASAIKRQNAVPPPRAKSSAFDIEYRAFHACRPPDTGLLPSAMLRFRGLDDVL
jgi:hypothetical protein